MNANITKETAYVKKHFPFATVSVAACAVIAVALAATGMDKDTTKVHNTENSSVSQTEKHVSAFDESVISENAVAVTKAVGSPFTITDENRVAAIKALVEKAMTFPVNENCDIPACRTLEYYSNGEKYTVELGDEGYSALGVYIGVAEDGDENAGTEYMTITVNGTKYLVERYADESPFQDLLYATAEDTPMFFDSENLITYDDNAVSKALEIISDIQKNGTLNTDIPETEPGEPNALTLSETPDADISFTLDGIRYYAGLFEADDIICIKQNGCIGDEAHTSYYKNARAWIDRFNTFMDSTEMSEAYLYTSRELSAVDVYNNPEVVGYIRIPELVNASGQEYVNIEVTQHDDNEYYYHYDYVERATEAGNVFADYKAAVAVTDDKRSDNVTLYGSNVRTIGTMFTHLTDLDDGTGEMLKKCPDILFGTIREDQLDRYAIIGAGCVKLEDNSCFAYEYTDFDDSSYTFDNWMTNIKDTCSIMRDIDCNADDDYLTLVTDIPAEGAEDYRFAVFARKLRSPEEVTELNFKAVKESPFVIPPVEELEVPELLDLTEEQAVAALKEAGLECVISYEYDDFTEKGHVCEYYDTYYDPLHHYDFVCKGAVIKVCISLGEYEGPMTEATESYPYSYPLTKDLKLDVPVPDSLRGSYTFSIFWGNDTQYTRTIDDVSKVESISYVITEPDKMRLAVYAKNNNDKNGKYIRYADYEADHAGSTCKLIGELNTDELLKTMD